METVPRIIPGRKILGISAILLPFENSGGVDWAGFQSHVERTLRAGLIPAVNMDTGYANLIDEATRQDVLKRTKQVCGDREFVAGAYVGDKPGAAFNLEQYLAQIQSIQSFGGTPVIFQSFGLTALPDEQLIEAYGKIGAATNKFIAFELGQMFAPFGKIYSIDVYRELMQVKQCIGAKHSSLNRVLEWQRLSVRDSTRPEFKVFTGNDLAIDMVIYGSDYLLGLSTMAPDLFGLRDQFWEKNNPDFYHLNDILQYLGFFAFRHPVPAYKHSAAQWLHLRKWIASDKTHPNSPDRPSSDIAILSTLLDQLRPFIESRS